MPEKITWTAYEHEHTEKGSDWYWALGIVALSAAIVAVLFQNFFFAILILVGSFTLALLAAKPARELTFSLTARGVLINQALYPYETLVAFWIQDRDSDNPTLIIDVQRFMTPHIITPIAIEDIETIREFLLTHLPEEELREPFGQRFLERFGF